MKRKVIKYIILCFIIIILFYPIFMLGRYSWLIGKPEFFCNSKEKLYINKAKEYFLEDGMEKEQLVNFWIQDAVIVHFKNDENRQICEVILEKTTANMLQSSSYMN